MDFFESEISERLEEGKNELTNNIKLLLFQEHPDWCDLVDFDDERIFLEPLLYAYYNFQKDRLHIPQILYGYTEPRLRPKKIQVQSDHRGIVFLPNLGYLKTSAANKMLDLYGEEDKVILKNKEVLIPYEKMGIHYLPESRIEVVQFNNISFSNFFKKENVDTDPRVEETFSRHIDSLQKAFAILKANSPFPFKAITDVVTKLVLYNSTSQRSFASIRANGAAFFNVRESMDEVFLLEDITHQCGHIVYYYVLWDKVEYFKDDIHTPLQHYTKNSSDKRTVLGGFYSLLPFALSNLTSSSCRHNQVFTGTQQVEFEGRFAFRMQKFLMDIRNFDNRDIFTEKGWELFQLFKRVAYGVYETHKDLIERFDISNQEYEFDMQSFTKLNQKHFQTMPL